MKVSKRFMGIGAAVTVGGALAGGSATSAPAGSAPSGAATAQAVAASTASALVASRPAFLHASPSEAFVQRSVVSVTGVQYVPYERTYAGLPVVGGDFVLVVDGAAQVVFSSVALERPIGSLSVTPALTSAAAEVIAARLLLSVSQVESTQLVVQALGPTPRLAWESTVDGVGAAGISRLTVDVDALTGAVLRQQEHVMHGSGTAAWSGPNPVALNTTLSAGTFSMRDPGIVNLSCQDAANNTTFSGPDDLWGNGNATVRETGCVDALFGAQTEARMLSQWLGRNAMDGAGGAWPIRVGLNDLNAFYDGTQVQIGHNTNNQWIASLDVIAHEMGHGVDDHTPGGISRNGTQEFIADTFGASTEWFANEPAPFDVPDFTVGEQINLVGTGPIRNMSNPSALGDPNCYSSAIPSTEVHAAAGPGNHWFYLLAEGSNPTNGQPTSPTCNGSTVVGLGMQNAMRILYNAMLMKTSASSYLTYRTWTLQATKNLFPGSCDQFNTVRAAWDAVSVPSQPGDPTCAVAAPTYEVAFQANTSNLWTVGRDPHGDWLLGMAAGTSPSIATLSSGGYVVAFQANTGNLWTTGSTGSRDWGLGMMHGTSPSVTALPNGGFEVAFQANTGNLWTVGTDPHGDWGLGMAAGTSPSITALANGSYEVAFQANTGNLWTVGTDPHGDWGLGMAAGTSPAIAGLANGSSEVAFQANTTSLWTVGSDGHGAWNLGMAAGTSPAITALPGSRYEVAFQANTTSLWTVGADGHGDWGLGMLSGTSPAITSLANGSYEVAFQANTTSLWTIGSDGHGAWNLGMLRGTSPAITR